MWSICWPRGRDETPKVGVSIGKGLTYVGTLWLRQQIRFRVPARTMQVHFCILKNAITIHFVWHTPAKVTLSLVRPYCVPKFKVRCDHFFGPPRTEILDESNSGSRVHDSMVASRSRCFQIAPGGPRKSRIEHQRPWYHANSR